MTVYQIMRTIIAVITGGQRHGAAIATRARGVRRVGLLGLLLAAVIIGCAWGASSEGPAVSHTPTNRAEACAQLVTQANQIIAAQDAELAALLGKADPSTYRPAAAKAAQLKADP